MNAFFVPQLGSMIYTMNGMTTRLNLESDREGDFYGRSTQFSGDGFPGMQFMLRAVSTDAFEAWSRAARDSAAMLDRDEYANLTKQSMSVRPTTYRLADIDLFRSIATQALPPGPGPTMGRPTPRRLAAVGRLTCGAS